MPSPETATKGKAEREQTVRAETAPTDTGVAPPQYAQLLMLQRLAGNAAVAHMLQRAVAAPPREEVPTSAHNRDNIDGADHGHLAASRPSAHELIGTKTIQRVLPNLSRAPAEGPPAGARHGTAAKQGKGSRKPVSGFGRKPHALSKAQVKKFDQEQQGIDAALDVLTPFIHHRGNAYLDQWLTQMNSAKSDAQTPPQDENHHWIVALLGNLVWAASVFVPGAGVFKGAVTAGAEASGVAAGMTSLGKKMYSTMAVGGSLAGSGLVQRWARDPSGDPTGKEVVATVLNGKRKEMGKALERTEEYLAYDLAMNGFTVDRYQKNRTEYMITVEEAIWTSLFPTIAKDDLTAIYTSGLNAIDGALADFKRQYKVWKDQVQACANRYFVPMTQVPHTEDWPEAIRSGREQPLEYCRRRIPFKPTLNF